MERAPDFAGVIRQVLQAHADFVRPAVKQEVVLAFDDERGQYLLLYQGWDGIRRIHRVLLHLELRDGKIWVQYDGTEEGIATDLLDRGVPAECIVLAFHHPRKRQFTEFAVA